MHHVHCRLIEYFRKALAREEVRPKQDVICQQFLNGRCNWGTICNLIHPVGTQLDGSTVDASNGNQTILASSTDSAIVDPKILISVPADVKDDEVAAEIRSAEQPLLASPSSEPCPETEGPLVNNLDLFFEHPTHIAISHTTRGVRQDLRRSVEAT